MPHAFGPGSTESVLGVANLKVEEDKEEQRTGQEASTSFCPNCIKLKRRILELEEELARLRGEAGDMAGPLLSEQGLQQPEQAAPHPEQGPIEDFQGRLQMHRRDPQLGTGHTCASLI